MCLSAFIRRFQSDDSGAVTVDWVVLSAAVILIALPMLYVIGNGANGLSTRISGQLSTQSIASY